jgi:hypothetical protein
VREVGALLANICREGRREFSKTLLSDPDFQSLQKKLEEAEQHRNPSREADRSMT